MASICKINGKWRALIRRKGFPHVSRHFEVEDEARKWAADEERRMKVVAKKALDPTLRPSPYRVAGVYMLYRGPEVIYVGRSVHVYRRLNDHDRKAKDWDGFRVWPCADWAKAADLERKLIEAHRPSLNGGG